MSKDAFNDDDIIITDENRARMREHYLGGLCIAKQWIQDAIIKGNNPEPFENIFNHALENYKKKFGELK